MQIKVDLQKVPDNGPLLIAANHPNSFLDAIIIACFLQRPIHFLARSDVFKSKWSNYILRRLNLLPIYRLQEGKDRLKDNERTFEECSEILAQNGAVLIFVEGLSLIDMKLRPIKKGLARIAYHYYEKTKNQDLKIATIALNYDKPKEFRSKVMMAAGNSLNFKDYVEEEEGKKAESIIQVNAAIFSELKDHTIEVDEDNEHIYHALTALDSSYKENSLSRKFLIAKSIRNKKENKTERWELLNQTVLELDKLLEKYNLNFRKLKVNEGLNIAKIFLLIVLAPLALSAFLLNIIPLWLAREITNKKVKLDEFYASVRFGVNSILWLVYAAIITVASCYLSPWGLLSILLLYYSLKFFLWYREEWHYFFATLRLMKLKRNTEDYKNLQRLIKEIYKIKAAAGLIPKVE